VSRHNHSILCLRHPDNIRVGEFIEDIARHRGEAIQHRSFSARLKPMLRPWFYGKLIVLMHGELIPRSIKRLLALGYLPLFEGIVAGKVKIQGAGDDANRFLLSRVLPNGRMPMLGFCLLGKQNQQLNAQALGLNQCQYLRPFAVQILQAKISDLNPRTGSNRRFEGCNT
jgi:hypothetical protein